MTKKNFLNMLFVGITFFGTLVGAGFASGKEIWFYFAQWGNVSYFMIVFVCFLFLGSSILFFSFGKKFQIETVQECGLKIFGKFSSVFEILLVLSNLTLLSSMLAGADSLFSIVLPNFPYRLASVVTAIITLVVVCFGFKSITKTNSLIVPLLVLMICITFVACLFDGRTAFSSNEFCASNFFGSTIYGLLFVGSNMFFSGFIFARMGKEFEKKELFGGTLIGCIFLMLCLFAITILLLTNPSSIASDMPIVEIALSLNYWFAYVVLIIVWLGLLTTAFALLFTISNWLKTYFGNPVLMTTISSIIALILSGIGFNSFVKIVYPIMGVFGFLYIFFTIISIKKSKQTFSLKIRKKVKK